MKLDYIDGEVIYKTIESSDETIIIEGSGKGGGGGQPVELPDTLNSKQQVRLLLAVSKGPLENDFLKDVFLNGISYTEYGNDVTIETRPGTLDQTYIPGFTEVETPITGVGDFPKELLKDIDNQFIIEDIYTSARIILNSNVMVHVTDNGDRVGLTVVHEIYRRHRGLNQVPGNWELVTTSRKTGKATNPYSWDITVQRPPQTKTGDAWEINVVRITSNDNNNDKIQRATFISGINLIIETIKTYPGVALVGIILNNAKRFNGQIPEIKLECSGIPVYVPSTYDAINRVYENIPWLGDFRPDKVVTSNLAWILYDVLTTKMKPPVPKALVGLGEFYLFSKVCDERVNDGQGGKQPRYSFQYQFTERLQVPEFLMHLLTVGNAKLGENAFGQIIPIYDAPGQPITDIITNTNVKNGEFNYHSNKLEERNTSCNVTFMDKLLKGENNTITQENNKLIERYGLKPLDLVLIGCNNHAQAIRKARWSIWVNSIDTEIVTFTKSFAGGLNQIGQLIQVVDSRATNRNSHAMIKDYSISGDTTIIELDRAMVFNAGEVYKCSFFTLSIPVTNILVVSGSGTKTVITAKITANPVIGTPIVFYSNIIQPKTFKITNIKKEEDNEYVITALQHTEAKYKYIESGYFVTLPKGNHVDFSSFQAEAPTNISVIEVFSSTGTINKAYLEVKWDWDTNRSEAYKPSFLLIYRKDGLPFVSIQDIPVNAYDILNPTPGVYEIYVYAVNPTSGFKSTPATTIYNYRVVAAGSTLEPPESITVLGTSGTTFNSRDCVISILYNVNNNNKTDKILDYVLEIVRTSDLVVMETYIIPLSPLKGGKLNFTFAENIRIFGTPTRSFTVKCYSRDTIGDTSNPISAVFSNPVPALPNWTLQANFGTITIDITKSPEEDLAEYLIYRSTTPNFTKNDASLFYSGLNNNVVIKSNQNQVYYFSISVSDSFGRSGITFSTEQSASALPIDVDTFTYVGLVFRPNNPSVNRITWPAFTAYRNGANAVTVAANTTGLLWTTGTLYIYYVPGDSVLRSTTSVLAAISEGGQILASYRGGTDLTHDKGRAYIDGSVILAGTVAAAQLVANTAVITTAAQIASAIINSTHIGTAAIQTAHIATASINSLKVAGGAITAPESISAYSVTGYTPASINTADNATTTYIIPSFSLPLVQVDIAVNRIIFFEFTVSHADSDPGALIIGFVKNGTVEFPFSGKGGRTFDLSTRLVGGNNTSTHTLIAVLPTTANESATITIQIKLQNYVSSKWSNATPPTFNDLHMVAFTGKR